MWPFSSFKSIEDIPSAYFKAHSELNCVVVKIADGDTFRLKHTTRWSKAPAMGSTDNTLNVRIAAVDTPEISRNKKVGQPYSEEAKLFATKHLLGQRVKLKLLSKDQYGRIIGMITYRERGFFIFTSSKRNISEELLKEGLAVVYRKGGAQYDGSIDHWNKLEENAIRLKKGMWVNGKDGVQLPSQYKQNNRI